MITLRRSLLAAALVLVTAVGSATPGTGAGSAGQRTVASPAEVPAQEPAVPAPTDQPPLDPTDDVGIEDTAFGDEAIRALGDRLPEVAARNGRDPAGLRAALEDPTFGLDSTGALFVAEAPQDHEAESATTEPTGPDAPTVAQAPVVPLEQTFTLHSKPGSQRTVFLDFDGHDVTGTGWNIDHGVAEGFQRGYSLDGDFSTFNAQERTVIQDAWQRVAEDFAPFDVDVTTQDPGAAAITRTDSSDNVYGARALISQSSTFPTSCPDDCAGIAYVGNLDITRDHREYQTAWIKGAEVGPDAKYMADVITHEIGHNGNLQHAGTTTSGYYGGLGNWGPIMGAPYSRAVTQWATADYPSADRFGQAGDDLTVLSQHGIAQRPDEAGPQPSSASAFVAGSPTGRITHRGDVDVWALGSCEGGATVKATPAALAPNLDIGLSLVNGAGQVLASADPLSDQTSLRIATGMDATVSVGETVGAIYARVEGVGRTGVYSDYGSIGPYTVSVTCTAEPDPAPVARTFTDVPGTHAFAAEISWMAGEGISTGYDDGTFRPAAPVLREQMAAFLARFAGVEASLKAPTTREFVDVPVTATFARHISWLADQKISTGYPDGTFRPAQPVLREQMAAFLYRLADPPPVSTSSCRFSDVPATHAFRAQICWLSSTGISTGYSDGTFRPGQPVLREQMAAFLFRFDQRGLLP